MWGSFGVEQSGLSLLVAVHGTSEGPWSVRPPQSRATAIGNGCERNGEGWDNWTGQITK